MRVGIWQPRASRDYREIRYISPPNLSIIRKQPIAAVGPSVLCRYSGAAPTDFDFTEIAVGRNLLAHSGLWIGAIVSVKLSWRMVPILQTDADILRTIVWLLP
jgi:hypothetical protein